MSERYERNGHSICLKGVEWPPILRDNKCDEKFIQRIVDLLNAESDVREMVAKAYERCATLIVTSGVQFAGLKESFDKWASNIRSGKEPL